jgi:hypothetical protein
MGVWRSLYGERVQRLGTLRGLIKSSVARSATLASRGSRNCEASHSQGYQRTWRLNRLKSALPPTANITKSAYKARLVPHKRKSDDLTMTSPGHASSTRHLRFMSKRQALLGPQPPVLDLPTQDAENRFAQAEHPLARCSSTICNCSALDKAAGMRVKFYPVHLDGWARVRPIGEVDQGNLRTGLPTTGP